MELVSESFSGLKGLNSKKASYDKEKKTCSGVYCHSSGETEEFREYKETPPWGTSYGALRCQSCHGTPPSYDNKKGRENSHFNTIRGSGHLLGIHWDATRGHTKESLSNNLSHDMGCSTCHYVTVSEDRDTTFKDNVNDLFTCSKCHDNKNVMGMNRTGIITNRAYHVNGTTEIAFRPEKFRTTAQLTEVPAGWTRIGKKRKPLSYDETEKTLSSAHYVPEKKTCLNIACHLLGTEIRWGDRVDCSTCHRDFGPR
jgi:predicted CxxxxCH...CXXCH cytochrome family protein